MGVELSNMIIPMLLVTLLTSFLLLLFFFTKSSKQATNSKPNERNELPKPYPIIGHLFAFYKLSTLEIFEWVSKIIATSPTMTLLVHLPFGRPTLCTGDPAVLEHILKTKFETYVKGPHIKAVFKDVFGDSLFTQNGDIWKYQRHLASQEFTHAALDKFVGNIVKSEISERLIPVLSDAAKNNKVIDLQDVLQRFTFDSVCSFTLGYNPGYLSPSMPDAKYSRAFDEGLMVAHDRFHATIPILWKICRFLNIGSEKRHAESIRMIRGFVATMIETHKQKPKDTENTLLSKLLKEENNEKLVIDEIISFILAGRDTSASALTWFFWLLHKNNHVEHEVLQEINNTTREAKKQGNSPSSPSSPVEELKGTVYTHAALSESMRLYPPVAVDSKEAASDDILPDGTRVKKGMLVLLIIYAMGRSEKLWGQDWPEFRPERWLTVQEDKVTGEKKRRFVARDSYSYPVFLGGPRICLGKEMAFLQMKSIVAAVLTRFKVVPAVDHEFDPVYIPDTIAKMHGGFPVRIVERVQV